MKTYFAYGTLLDVASMKAFAPSADAVGPMRLDGYRMGFAETHRKGKGGCTLVQEDGGEVWGLLYRMSDEDMARMDEASGVPEGLWVHLPVTVTDRTGAAVETVTYTIPGDAPAFRPGHDYVGKILAGLDVLPFPADYVSATRSRIAEATG
jgi:cation transport regulator ChaC